MNAAPNPADPPLPPGSTSISAAADRARAELHQEIARVRAGVEEMLAEQQGASSDPIDPELRRELDTLHEESRRYAKSRVRKTEKRLQKSIHKVDERTDQLEQRLDQMEAERREAEWRIHTGIEQLLDGLLQEVRAIADRLEGRGTR